MTSELRTPGGDESVRAALPILCKACQYNRILALMLTAIAERETDEYKKYDLLTAISFLEETYNWLNVQISLIAAKKSGGDLEFDVQPSAIAQYH